jgi:hypothetical protein
MPTCSLGVDEDIARDPSAATVGKSVQHGRDQTPVAGTTVVCANMGAPRSVRTAPTAVDVPAEFGGVVDAALNRRRRADTFAGWPAGRAPRRLPGWFPGQAVTGGSLVWRGRRLRGAPAVPVVDPGLRPRFFSVFPTPANFRSR